MCLLYTTVFQYREYCTKLDAGVMPTEISELLSQSKHCTTTIVNDIDEDDDDHYIIASTSYH